MVVPGALAERGDRFLRAIAAIDAANADDPVTIVVDGVTRPKEQAHAELACHWVLALDPAATDEQLLAARAHHLRRWELPRTDYPEGRAGYLRWRTEQKRRHAQMVGDILETAGFDEDTAMRVGAIIRKEGLRTDPAVQTHEDALCLVFIETQFDALAEQLGEDKMTEVVAKTIAKMSDAGLAETATISLSPQAAQIVRRAAALAAEKSTK